MLIDLEYHTLSAEYLYNTKVAGVGEIFVLQNLTRGMFICINVG